MILTRKWIVAVAIPASLICTLPFAASASEAELEETKAKTAALVSENETLAARIKELEAKTLNKDSMTNELDEKITLIKARLTTDE